jgi:uncharacterized protein
LKGRGFTVERWDVAGSSFGVVAALWRYPVKSFQGESLQSGAVALSGIHGDRAFGIFERSSDVLLSAKRIPKLLEGAASLVAEGTSGSDVVAELKFGATKLRSDDPHIHGALSSWLGIDVELRQPKPGRRSIVEMQVDLDDDSQLAEFNTRAGTFFDGSALNVLSTTSLAAAASLYPAGAWVVERFRPNILIETDPAIAESSTDTDGRPGFVDDDLVGFLVTLGTAEVVITKRCDRCVMVTRPVGTHPRDRALLRTLSRFHGNELGIDGTVNEAGIVNIGDRLTLLRRT